jgi:hypothetical protein
MVPITCIAQRDNEEYVENKSLNAEMALVAHSAARGYIT